MEKKQELTRRLELIERDSQELYDSFKKFKDACRATPEHEKFDILEDPYFNGLIDKVALNLEKMEGLLNG
jgi:hypothetical protein